ncbi:hypothetical protein MMC34_003663 [Xylographa carneopallida]|nr:hypothetical protein [Xylographa carneopallida]
MPDTPLEPTAASGRLGDVLGTETISLFVGPEQKQYVVHRQLLYDTVPYFSKLLNEPFATSKADHIDLNNEFENPIAIELFCHWLYRGFLPDIPEGSNTIIEEIPFHHLHYTADKWRLPILNSKTKDRIKHFHLRIGRWVVPVLMAKGFENTPTNSPHGSISSNPELVHAYLQTQKREKQYLLNSQR